MDHRDAGGRSFNRNARYARVIAVTPIGQQHTVGCLDRGFIVRATQRLCDEFDTRIVCQCNIGQIRITSAIANWLIPLDNELHRPRHAAHQALLDRRLNQIDPLVEPRRAEAGKHDRFAGLLGGVVTVKERGDAGAGEQQRGDPAKLQVLAGKPGAVGGEHHLAAPDGPGKALHPPFEQHH